MTRPRIDNRGISYEVKKIDLHIYVLRSSSLRECTEKKKLPS